MSGSPKYTTAGLYAQAAAVAAAARRAREAARRAAEAAARQAYLRQRAQQFVDRLADVVARLDLLDADARQVGVSAAVQTVRGEAGEAARRLRGAATEDAVAFGDRVIVDLETRVAQLVQSVTAGLARKQRQDAVAAVRAQLAAASARVAFDPAGAGEVDGMLTRADSAATDAAFATAFGALTARVAGHLAAAAGHQAAFERTRDAARQETERLKRLLDEAGEAGLDLPGARPARSAAQRLRQALSGGWPGAGALSSADADLRKLHTANGALETELEEWMRRLDRAAAVAAAVVAAAPRAGLRVVPGSFVRERGHLMFRTTRTDDESTLDIDVAAAEGDKVSVGYHGTGTDFRTELTTDGQEKRCDLTAEILTRLHTELAAEGVGTDGLHWEGKPIRETKTHQVRTPQKPRERQQ
ncbi:hypothetical protein [Catenulispora rubra]|uniref:hypothetical protein n=1 Tax=Catenulispora rubra TaxID=280293 RepID=UPI002263B806|nr:hypothetical protein [Catenulispora rubra]